MRYLSIYKSKETGVPPSPEHIATMGKLIEKMMKAGTLLATEGCLPTSKGARVRVTDGTFSVIDGPFTETKEVVGGFALLEATSKDHALDLVKEFLTVVGDGECELRQLYEAPPS